MNARQVEIGVNNACNIGHAQIKEVLHKYGSLWSEYYNLYIRVITGQARFI